MWMTVLTALALLATPETEIRGVLDRQVADWNRGDIESFMKGYENAESTTFSGKTFTRGYRQVLENYRKRYPTREAMDHLEFSALEVRMLGEEAALVTGRFLLTGRKLSGNFTLVFRKTRDGWKIVHDHTS